ncbi:MAG: N-formylglutamate amidohydrolase [Candidatus Scalindua sp.]|nr:N-formylglutamate amidohydrolase [Candidatus Scalindua sp.]
MDHAMWKIIRGDGPLIGTAIHNGHELRDEVAAITALSDGERLREEDSYTGKWAEVVETNIVVGRSRFEVDLNRPRDKAFYRFPEDAWGLNLWKEPPGSNIIQRSIDQYDSFYKEVNQLLREKIANHGSFLVLDIHSYNHLREGPDGPIANPESNPEVNVGTGTMDRNRWAPLVDRFISELNAFKFLGRNLDVRENVKFRGGEFPRWVHTNFPENGCALAVEFKKFFMNEWNGELNQEMHKTILQALRTTLPGLAEELRCSGVRF